MPFLPPNQQRQSTEGYTDQPKIISSQTESSLVAIAAARTLNICTVSFYWEHAVCLDSHVVPQLTMSRQLCFCFLQAVDKLLTVLDSQTILNFKITVQNSLNADLEMCSNFTQVKVIFYLIHFCFSVSLILILFIYVRGIPINSATLQHNINGMQILHTIYLNVSALWKRTIFSASSISLYSTFNVRVSDVDKEWLQIENFFVKFKLQGNSA